MTVLGVLVCAALVALLAARDAYPDRRPPRVVRAGLWLMFAVLLVPRAIALAT